MAGDHSDEHVDEDSIEYFKQLLYSTQKARVKIVQNLWKKGTFDEDLVTVIRHALQFLQDERTSADHQRHMNSAGLCFGVNVKDEVLGLQKDVIFLDRLLDGPSNNLTLISILSKVNLPQILGKFHAAGEEAFAEEVEATLTFLNHFLNDTSGVKPLFITDWDGTMKSYTSQYATNLQPVYSALGMAEFAQSFTRLSAVLTAGPLRGPGILDLTALPIDGPIIFSGSWGREWYIDRKRSVYDDGIDETGVDALERMNDEMKELLSTSEFAQFALVGSGVQRKVDRITLGVQTVCGQVDKELSSRYQEAVKERMYRVDPNQQTLVFDEATTLEVEVCLHHSGSVWHKGNGVERLLEAKKESMETGRVLIAGDTSSDLPMLKYAVDNNPQGSFALFVGTNEALEARVHDMVGDTSRVCCISSPDVFHAALAKLLPSTYELD